MKTRFVKTCALALLGAAVAWAQSSAPRINLDESAKPAAKPEAKPAAKPEAKPAAAAKGVAPAGKVDPNKPAVKADPAKATSTKDGKKKEDEPGKIEGMEIPRGNGFMGLQIVNGTFKLTFYDAKKKPVPPEAPRAAFRWNVSYQKQPERVVLQSDGKALISERTIKPPYQFKLFITLIKGEGDDNVENLTVDFSQS